MVFFPQSMPMSEKPFDFWQDHAEAYLKSAFRSDRRCRISGADGYGKRTGDCGDTVEIFLTVQGRRITTLNYDIDGCLNTNACVNALAAMAEGRTLSQAWKLGPDDVIAYLQTLPKSSGHCAELCVGAFYLALADVQELQRHPWKKRYR
jgi:nitrogen fixation NifU-like protein